MKGKYGGRHMTTYGTIIPGAATIARLALRMDNISERAKEKLKIIDWHNKHGNNISKTGRHFGIQRSTLRTWLTKVKQLGPAGLNNLSHRPKHLRRPTTKWETVAAIVALRKQYPAWSKHKLQIILSAKGIVVSASTVGRILKRKGLINRKISAKRKRSALHPKTRFKRGLSINSPGGLIQMDTKHIMLPGGKKHYQFTAIDVLTKQRMLEVYSSESSKNGADFLLACQKEFDFKIAAVQTDNGTPWQKEFEKLCLKQKLIHYYIYPKNPKQNTYVEISHGADQREFYEQGNVRIDKEMMREKLKEWQIIWNEIRPHEALNYLTPKAYFLKWQTSRLPTKDIITLQT